MARRRLATALIFLIGCGAAQARAAETTMPDFLPSFYINAIAAAGPNMKLRAEGESDGFKTANFESADGRVEASVALSPCTLRRCDALFTQLLREFDAALTSEGGQFLTTAPNEFAALQHGAAIRKFFLYAKLPTAIAIWTRTSSAESFYHETSEPDSIFANAVMEASDRHRYESAKSLNNAILGAWAPSLQSYAKALHLRGRTMAAVDVLREAVAWAPTNFEVQLDFAELTADAVAARESAQVVWANAENEALADRAAKLLGKQSAGWASAPVLKRPQRGLRLVLVPLQPVDIRLARQAAQLFEDSFDIPVSVTRLPTPWLWGPPERVHRQVDMENFIQSTTDEAIDFKGWTAARFVKELRKIAGERSALDQYGIETFLAEVAGSPGQYDVDRQLPRFVDAIRPYQTDDRRTMFVAITAQSIFAEGSYYVFNTGGSVGNHAASIMSYHMMTAAALGEPYASRKRLIEHVTKELVPASLKLLGIPRPADPTDPYSFSGGTERLSEKTLNLSEPTRRALDRLRDR